MKNSFLFILIKSDNSIFKIGSTTNLDETIEYYEDVFRFRKDRSFVFEGEFNQIKNLEKLLTSLLYNFNTNLLSQYEDENYKNMYHIKGIDLIKSFSENFHSYRIRVKRHSLRKALEQCKPLRKILSRKNKVQLAFDYKELSKEQLENKYNMPYDDLKNINSEFMKDMYKPHKKTFRHYLTMRTTLKKIKESLLKSL